MNLNPYLLGLTIGLLFLWKLTEACPPGPAGPQGPQGPAGSGGGGSLPFDVHINGSLTVGGSIKSGNVTFWNGQDLFGRSMQYYQGYRWAFTPTVGEKWVTGTLTAAEIHAMAASTTGTTDIPLAIPGTIYDYDGTTGQLLLDQLFLYGGGGYSINAGTPSLVVYYSQSSLGLSCTSRTAITSASDIQFADWGTSTSGFQLAVTRPANGVVISRPGSNAGCALALGVSVSGTLTGGNPISYMLKYVESDWFGN